VSPTDEQAGAWTEAFESGKFIRKSSEFRDRIAEGELFDVETGRYHLYISHACPWAHRTLITRKVLGLENHISVDVVDWRMNSDGSWSFNPEEEGVLKECITGLFLAGAKAVELVLSPSYGIVSTALLLTMKAVKSSECSMRLGVQEWEMELRCVPSNYVMRLMP
jgi:glutathionyl-hydroquinone reductase